MIAVVFADAAVAVALATSLVNEETGWVGVRWLVNQFDPPFVRTLSLAFHRTFFIEISLPEGLQTSYGMPWSCTIGGHCRFWPPFLFSDRSARALKGELSAPCVLRRPTAHRNIRKEIPHCHVGVLMLGCVYMIYIEYMNALGGPLEHVETNNISESIFFVDYDIRFSLVYVAKMCRK